MDVTVNVSPLQEAVNESNVTLKSDVGPAPPVDVSPIALVPPEVYMTIGIYMLVTGVLGTGGNAATVAMFLRVKRYRTSVDFLLLNLAVADIGMTGLCFPFVSASSFAKRWLFGDIGCTVYGFLGFTFGNASIILLTAVSIERYLVVCRKRPVNVMNMKVFAARVGGTIWVHAIVWACIPLIIDSGYRPEPFQTSCTINWYGDKVQDKVFVLLLSTCLVGVGVVVMVTCYVLVYRTTRMELIQRNAPRAIDAAVTKVCLVLVSAFLFCWMPYATFSLWGSFGDISAVPPAYTAIPVMVAKLSSCVNPLLYMVTTRRFRLRYLATLCPCKPQPVVGSTVSPTTSALGGPSRVRQLPIQLAELPGI